MKKEITLSHSDLLCGVRIRYCGYHDCPGGYAYGPVARDEYILHFVREGAGRYQINRATYHVGEGSTFTLFPGYLLHYEADKADPWHYHWVAFDGCAAGDVLQRLGVTPSNPVVCHRRPRTVLRAFERLLAAVGQRSLTGDIAAARAFWQLLLFLAEDVQAGSDAASVEGREQLSRHVVRAVAMIQEGYHRSEFSIEEAAGRLCLERSYFGRIFKSHTGQSPHQFLARTRVENACRLLEDFSLSVKEVAVSVGFRDQNYFDKVFRRSTGLSPSEYRQALRRRPGRAASGVERELLRNLNS